MPRVLLPLSPFTSRQDNEQRNLLSTNQIQSVASDDSFEPGKQVDQCLLQVHFSVALTVLNFVSSVFDFGQRSCDGRKKQG